jgi:exodeoxyribonuclease VII large subunit
VATSRVPTLVAIGHEIDVCLAELAADQRASTPSNAAELLLPDRQYALADLREFRTELDRLLVRLVTARQERLKQLQEQLWLAVERVYERSRYQLATARQLLLAYDPSVALQRGYALVRVGGVLVRSSGAVQVGDELAIQLHDGRISATITSVEKGTTDGKKD